MKTCTRCDLAKSLEHFYVNKAAPDGRTWRCIECTKALALAQRMKALGPVPENWKKKTADPKAYRAAQAALHPGRAAAAKKRYYARNRNRLKATQRFKEALKSGKIVRQPCFVCGVSPAHGHHPDYSHPLDVVWLCPPHHREVHRMVKNQVSSDQSVSEEVE